MVRYSDELIDEIRQSNDIVEIISQYVVLKRSGRNFFGLCPFHKENTPSFSVSPDKQIFHCFGCGVGGNVIHFLQKIESLDFKDTLEILADKAGITLPTLDNDYDTKQQQLKARLYELNEETAKFYHENLYKQNAKEAQEYVKKRKLDNKTLKAFQIGYSGNYSDLYVYLKSKNFTDNEILASNLVNRTEQGKFIDRFRKRLMFPILDVRNRVIAFGGRVLDDSLPKYINSPENTIYVKGRHLFGMNIAKNSRQDKIIIVEGYMDAISLHQRGITNVVASLGTALTEAQGRLLRKYCEKVVISYDSDAAGQAATIRGLEILNNLGCDVRILQMEGAKDPDEYIIKYGTAGYNKLVEQAISLTEFKIKVLKQQLNLENTVDKIKFLNQIAKYLTAITNKIEREVYIEKIAEEYKISKEAIYAEVNKLEYKDNKSSKVLEQPRSVNIPKKKPVETIDIKREDFIIKVLLNAQYYAYQKIKDIVKPEELKSEINKIILTKLYIEFEKRQNNIENILGLFEDAEIIGKITGILSDDYDISDYDKCIQDIIKYSSQEKLINDRNKIMEKLKQPGLTQEEIKQLENNLSEIIIKLAKSK